MLRILSGETEPDDGVVRRGRGARIGVLSQSTVLPAGTVRQAVGGTWQGEAMLQRFGMGDMLDASTDSLSGGQTKRVALAALLAGEPGADQIAVRGDACMAARLMPIADRAKGAVPVRVKLTVPSTTPLIHRFASSSVENSRGQN